MTLTRLKTRAYAAGLAAVLALAGCGDPDGGSGQRATAGGTGSASSVAATPPATANATTTAEVDPVLTRIPAAARPETREGAEAFAAFYIEQLNNAFKAGKSDSLEGLTDAACSRCETFRQAISSLEAKGERHAGDTLRVTHREALSFTNEERAILLEVELFQVPVVNAKGAQVDRTEADKGGFVATLVFEGHWQVSRLQVAQ